MKFDLRAPIIVAEIGASHNGDMHRALDLITAARDAGADAVKFQTYTPETLAVDRKIVGGPWDGRSYHELYREAMTPWRWFPALFDHAKNLGLTAFSSPFSVEAVDYLERIECPLYKIASPEVNHLDLIKRAGETHKPVIISTGLATATDISMAIHAANLGGASDVVLLHCVSAYPAQPDSYDLMALKQLRDTFKVDVGLSDHTIGSAVAVAAVALGATMIEKHITLKRSDGGPDSGFASEPQEFARMVAECHVAAAACRIPLCQDHISMQYKRSLWVVKPIAAGEKFSRDNVAVLRPADGMHPSKLPGVLAGYARCDIAAGTPLLPEHVEYWSPRMN